jgi:hypothetical protein
MEGSVMDAQDMIEKVANGQEPGRALDGVLAEVRMDSVAKKAADKVISKLAKPGSKTLDYSKVTNLLMDYPTPKAIRNDQELADEFFDAVHQELTRRGYEVD